jgi:hypothetical protein
MSPALLGVVAAAPVEPDRETARRWALEELAGREYTEARPNPLTRAISWLWEKLNSIQVDGGPRLDVGLLIFATLLALAIGYALYRTGGVRRMGAADRRGEGVFADSVATAAEHRAAADRHAAAGEWDRAVVERFRAIARELEERTVLTPEPGRTAQEVALDGGSALPDLAGALRDASGTFDAVSYGHVPVGPDADTRLRELDGRIGRAELRAREALR